MGSWLSLSNECKSSSGQIQIKSGNSKCTTINATPKVYKKNTFNYFPPVDRATIGDPSKEIRNCCEIFDNKGNKQCEVFRAKLQEFYATLKLPKVAWIDEGSELSLVKHFVQLELSESGKSIEIDEIFHSTNNKKRQRILIESQPGFGKTTLATKLAFDWAMNKQYINFKLLFFIPLRELQQQTIENAIVKIGERCGFQKKSINIEQILVTHEEEILFVLDGLDELSLKTRYETMKVLYNQMYSDSTVLTLCRTGSFKLTKEEHFQLFGHASNSDKFCNKHITILGIQSEERKREFLKTFIPEQNVNDIIKHLALQMKLFDSPLFLMMLPIIMEKDKTIGHFPSKTDLYKKLFNSILRHTCVKREIIDTNSEFDLFNSNPNISEIQECVKQFGELSVDKIVLNDLKFDLNDLTTKIYQLGLLIKHEEVNFFTYKSHYETFHLSIMEFAAAFALSICLKSDECASIEVGLELMVNHFFDTNGTSLILPFLASLMDDKLDLLLIQIESFSAWFNLNFKLTAKLIAECSWVNISKSKYLENFIPSFINLIDDLIDKVHTAADVKLLKYGCDCGKIKQLTIRQDQVCSRLISAKYTTQLILLSKFEYGDLAVYSNVSSNMQQILSNTLLLPATLDEWLRFAASPTIESCALDIDLNHFKLQPELKKTLTSNETFNKIKYRILEIAITNKLEKQFALNLLENNRVQHLIIGFALRDISDVLSAAAQSNNLTSLRLNDISFDLYDITVGGTKKYEFIGLIRCTATCRQPLLEKTCIECVRLLNPKDIGAITELQPSKFGCSTKDITDLIEKCPTWVGFNSVKYFSLNIIGPKQYREIFVSAWTNLQTLHLEFENESALQKMIADSIHKSSIVKLVVVISHKILYLTLFKHMNILWADRNNSKLKTIQLVCGVPSIETILELMTGLKCSYWDQVDLVSDYLAFHDVRKHLSNFRVNHFRDICNDILLGGPFDLKSNVMLVETIYNSPMNCLSISRKSENQRK